MEQTASDSGKQVSASTAAGPSNSLAVQVSEEIVKNVGELAAETAIAFAMTRGRARSKGKGTSSMEPPVKTTRRRPRKEPKMQLQVVSKTPVSVERGQPTPEGKKLSSGAEPGQEFLSGQQISQILGQESKKQTETSLCSGEAHMGVAPESSTCAPVTVSGQPRAPPVKKKRGRPRKIPEPVQAAAPPLSTPSQPPTSSSLPSFQPELLTTKPSPEPIASDSEDSDGAHLIRPTGQPPFKELDGWPIAAIAVNDSAGNMQVGTSLIPRPPPAWPGN